MGIWSHGRVEPASLAEVNLRIARLDVRVAAEGGARLVVGAEEWRRFLVDGGAAGAEAFELTTGPAGGRPWFPRGERLFRAGETWELHRCAEDPEARVLVWTPRSSHVPRTEARFAPGYGGCALRVEPWPDRPVELAALPPLVEIGFQSRTGWLGRGALVHALGLDLGGRGLLLPGSSGRGKSTLAGLFGLDEMLSDERPALVRGPDGRLEVHGTPWRGTARRIGPGGAPLAAIVLLGPHEGPFGLRAVGRAEAFRRLAFHAFPPWWDPAATARVLDLLLAATDDVPVFELRFRPGPEARALVEEALR